MYWNDLYIYHDYSYQICITVVKYMSLLAQQFLWFSLFLFLLYSNCWPLSETRLDFHQNILPWVVVHVVKVEQSQVQKADYCHTEGQDPHQKSSKIEGMNLLIKSTNSWSYQKMSFSYFDTWIIIAKLKITKMKLRKLTCNQYWQYQDDISHPSDPLHGDHFVPDLSPPLAVLGHISILQVPI